MTARLLETTIRVATAHSKLRFSRKIEKEDVKVARDLLHRVVDQSKTIDGVADETVQIDEEIEAPAAAAAVPEIRSDFDPSHICRQPDEAHSVLML